MTITAAVAGFAFGVLLVLTLLKIQEYVGVYAGI